MWCARARRRCYRGGNTNGPRQRVCTLSHDQLDLDFAQPEVLAGVLRIIRLHVDMRADIRLDAVAFSMEADRDPSIHLPRPMRSSGLMRFCCVLMSPKRSIC